MALIATDGLGYRLVLATLLAIGAMFGAWAVDLTLKDTLLVPAANAPATQQTPVASPLATSAGAPLAARVHVVRPGDTLRGLAAQIYGDESHWRLIYDANRDRVNDPQNLLIGTRLQIPDP